MCELRILILKGLYTPLRNRFRATRFRVQFVFVEFVFRGGLVFGFSFVEIVFGKPLRVGICLRGGIRLRGTNLRSASVCRICHRLRGEK